MPIKLLDYGNKSPFRDTIGGVRNLAWPVAVYRVTLPYLVHGNDDNSLNPFECVILRLLGIINSLDMPNETFKNVATTSTEQKLAYATRIPIDLVRTILFRLQDKGYIDENNSLIAEKREQLDTALGGDKKNYNYVSALVFRELTCGEFLPFIHVITEKNPLKQVEEDEKKKMYHLPGGPSKWWKNLYPAPSAQDVINIKKAMLKRSLAYGHQEAVPILTQITIVEQPEYYYLNCPIAIQKGDEDFRIADPFETGFSLALEKSFYTLLAQDQKLKEWFLNWKGNLSRITEEEDSEADLFWNSHKCKRLYPELISSLHPGRGQRYRTIGKIYASLEWALYYYCVKRTFESSLHILELTPIVKHQNELVSRALKYGFILTQKFHTTEATKDYVFQGIRPGKILDFKNGKAELATVLAISLLLDERHNDVSGMQKVARQHPDFLWKLMEIKSERDSSQHGNKKRSIDGEELSSDSFMRDTIQALLPDVQFPENPLTGTSIEKLSDTRLDAITHLQAYFDFCKYNKLSENAKLCLINAERFVIENENSNSDRSEASTFVSNLYSALQASIRPHLQKFSLANIDDAKFFEYAEKSAIGAGFPNLPESLTHVKPSKIRETLYGNDRSLGACIIAFLILGEKDELKLLHSRSPSLLADISDIILRRGHDNQSIQLSKAEILTLRKKAFHSINTLLEV